MRRMIGVTCAAILLAALLAGPAQARVKHYSGKIDGGGNVRFDVKFKRGKPKLAGAIEVKNLPVTCATGPTAAVQFSHGALDLKVRRRFFSTQFPPLLAAFSAIINKKGKKAKGTLDYGPSDAAESTACDADGPLLWKARKLPVKLKR